MKLFLDNGQKDPKYTIGERIISLPHQVWHRTLSRFTDESLILGPNTEDFFILKFYQDNEIQFIYTGDSEEQYTSFSENKFKIDLYGLVADEFQITHGEFMLIGNFYQRIFNTDATFIVPEISADRREIRVELAYTDDEASVGKFRQWSDAGEASQGDIIQQTAVAWFNATYECMVVSWARDKYGKSNSTILRLAQPLPDEINEGDILNLYHQKLLPFTTTINVQLQDEQEEEHNRLRQPAFRYSYNELPQAGTVEYRSQDQLLNATGSVTQSIKNLVLSSSNINSTLNVDYRDYNNFVCFSSATERLNNFKLKVKQIEYYNSQVDFVTSQLDGLLHGGATGSVEFLENKAIYESKLNDIKVSFDGYEKYLYYSSHSAGEDRNRLDIEDFKTDINYVSYYNSTWPKTNSSKPYTLASAESVEATDWFTRQLATASYHDTNNPHTLKEQVPDHIKLDSSNSDYLLFVDMIGHHFDSIYTYIKHIAKINNRDESLYEGISKDLIYEAAKSMGWTLQPGFDLAELWDYVNGTDASGSYVPGNEVESYYDDLLLRVGYENKDGNFTLADTSKYNRTYVARTIDGSGDTVYNQEAIENFSTEVGAFGNAGVYSTPSGSMSTYAAGESDWINSGSFSVSFWAKFDSTAWTFESSRLYTILDARSYGDNDEDGVVEQGPGFGIFNSLSSGIGVLFADKNGGLSATNVTITNSEATGSLTHYVMNVDRNEVVDFFVNGQHRLKDTSAQTGLDASYNFPSSSVSYGTQHGQTFERQGISIGGKSETTPFSDDNMFTGSLDDVRVYGRLMTTQSVQDLYTQPERYRGSVSYIPGKETPSFEDVDKQIWKRILNNLPQLLKSKGTKRSINTFLSCYGIPKTLMNVQEFGGSAPIDGADFQEITKHNYGIHISESACIGLGRSSHNSSNINGLDVNAFPQTIQLRFKSYSQSSQLTPQSLILGSNRWGILLQPIGGGTGSVGAVKFYIGETDSDPIVSASIELPIFDGDWWNLQLSTDVPLVSSGVNVVYTLRCAKSGDHEDNQITHSGTAQLTVNGSGGGLAADYNDQFKTVLSNTQYKLGYSSLFLPSYTSNWAQHFTTGSGWSYSTDAPDMNFSGSLQEYREYAEEISEETFHKHTMAPTAYFGNHYTSSYDTLVRRFTLGSDGVVYNHNEIEGEIHVSSSHPNQSQPSSYFYNGTTVKDWALFQNFRNETDTDGNYKEQIEEHYISVPNSIGNKRSDRKIRNLETYSDGFLSPNKTHDSSSLDFIGKDSNIVQVALSPTDNTDLDIAYQFGENRVDDFVGDPRDRYKTHYPQLKELRDEYFKKYSKAGNPFEFAKILNYFNKGFFRQLENLLPARAVKRVGLIIKPHSLERSKVQGQPSVLYDATSPSLQSFDSSGVRQRDEYRENFTFEGVVTDMTASFINAIGTDKLFDPALSRDGDYSNADTYVALVDMSGEGMYSNGLWVSQSSWQLGTTSSLENFTWMDSRAITAGHGVRDFAPTESSLRHRLPRFEKLNQGLQNLYYLGSKQRADGFNTNTDDTVDGGPLVSFILIKTNQLIVRENTRGGKLNVT